MHHFSGMALGLFCVAMIAATPGMAAAEPAVPHFEEDTATAGLSTSYDGEWEYIVGGGVAALDCDDDGFTDLYLPGGKGTARLYRNTSASGGKLTFAPVPGALDLSSVSGAYPIDIDSDGLMDLVVLRVGENVVMRGLGQCQFEPAPAEWGFVGGDGWSTAFAATWEKGNQWPTIAIGNYIDRHEEIAPWGTCTDNWLHRPAKAADRRWAPPSPLTPSFCPLSMLFSDWNLSGTPSLRVTNDREYYEGGQEQMWSIAPGAAPRALTDADGWASLRIWGMGIASTDVNGDRYPDYFLTSMGDNKLQVMSPPKDGGAPRPNYADIAHERGVAVPRPYTGGDTRPSTAWHAQFADVNNDTLPDLFVAKGNVDKMPDFAQKDPNNLLLGLADGHFVEVGDKAGIANNGNSRGGALVDFNRDGLLDLIVTNRNAPVQIWRNVTTGAGHWLLLSPRQPAPNVDAIGGWLEVRTGEHVQRQELTAGGGHAGGQSTWWHVGLGAAGTAEIAVVWPDGTRSDWMTVEADAAYLLTRGAAPVLAQPSR